MITLDNLLSVFMSHSTTQESAEHYVAMRQAATTFAETILRHTPACADQQAALRKVREALMTANAAVALGGLV